jgi:hypothetical protein
MFPGFMRPEKAFFIASRKGRPAAPLFAEGNIVQKKCQNLK